MIELEEAREKMTQHMKSQCETEEVALLDSLGRISGETIFAETAIPHFPRAGMDGYAVRAVETRGATAESPSCLKVVGSLVEGDSMFYLGKTMLKFFALSLRAKTMRKLEKILLFSKKF